MNCEIVYISDSEVACCSAAALALSATGALWLLQLTYSTALRHLVTAAVH